MNPLALSTTLAQLSSDFGLELGSAASGELMVHMLARGARTMALCGSPATRSDLPITHWGVETERKERWCTQCAAEAMELLRGHAGARAEQ